MTADNRTNEPTEAQITAALDALSRFNEWTDNPRGAMRAALETAARVPVQGDPNDDREALVRQERAKLVAVRDILNRDDFGDDWEHDEWVYRQAAERKLADIEEALGSEMLAVPDAIARVRELHRESEAYRETCVECSVGDNLVDWPCPTIRALEGDE